MIRSRPTPARASSELRAEPVAPQPTSYDRARAKLSLAFGADAGEQDLPGVPIFATQLGVHEMGSGRYYKGLRSKLARVRCSSVQVKAELVLTRGK